MTTVPAPSPSPLPTVYGVILNDRTTLDRMGPALSASPYGAPPRGPVLYIKPANTHAGPDAVVRLPRGTDRAEVAATLGLVLGRDATRLDPSTALAAVAGIRPILDVSLPNPDVYRPPIRERCFDGSCPMGATQPLEGTGDLSGIILTTLVNGIPVAARTLADLVRPAAQLLADVTRFMTLRANDVLMLGIALNGPQAGPGDRVTLAAAGFAPLSITLAEARP